MSAHFFNKLLSTTSSKFDDDGKWIRTVTVQQPLVFYTDSGDCIEVPAGFVSDGASVPKSFWSRYPPFGRYLPAAVVHDLLCVQGYAGNGSYTYQEAADIFKQAILCCGVGKFRAWKMWFAVRYFGAKWD